MSRGIDLGIVSEILFDHTGGLDLLGEDLYGKKDMLKRFIKSGGTPEQVALQIMMSEDCNELLGEFHTYFVSTLDRERFEEECVVLMKNWLDSPRGFSFSTTQVFFENVQDLDKLIKRHRDFIVGDLRRAINADTYWQKRVRWYINKKNLTRAWDELLRSIRGLHTSDKDRPADIMRGRVDFRLQASWPTVAELTQELFDAVSTKATFVVEEIDGRYSSPSLLRVRDHHRSLFKVLQRARRSSWYDDSKEGVQLALMALHFRMAKNKKRRDKLSRKPD